MTNARSPVRAVETDRLLGRSSQPHLSRGPRPSGHASIAAKQPAESLIGDDRAVVWRFAVARRDQAVAESLVWPVGVVEQVDRLPTNTRS